MSGGNAANVDLVARVHEVMDYAVAGRQLAEALRDGMAPVEALALALYERMTER